MKFPAVVFLSLAVITSCGINVPPSGNAAVELRGSSLVTADVLLKQGSRLLTDDDVAVVYQLRAAEIAWQYLDTDGGSIRDIDELSDSQQHALRIIQSATERVARNFVGEKSAPEKEFSYGGVSYRVSSEIRVEPGIWSLGSFQSAMPAAKVRHSLCANWHTEPGVGVPCAPKWKRPDAPEMQRFVTDRGYLEPITLVMNFRSPAKPGASRRVSIAGYDPTYRSRVNLGRTEYPLAADFTAPIVEQTHDINEFAIALTGLVHPGVLDSRLILVESYDPQRIPVLLVHGLNSHPRMWRNVLNDIRADPKLRGKYQFIFYYYPTAWPIIYASMRLREDLHAFQKTVGPMKKMVLVGHSMGGLLSQMQVIDPERKIWDAQFGKDAYHYFSKIPADSLVRRSTLFSPNSEIGREIYICTPHRGSGLADLSLTAWFIKLVKLPSAITSAFIDLPGNLIERGQLTSVAGLSPSNPLYKALDEIPIRVPYNSIVGDRGRGNTPNSSDGVVPYWSSHLAGAQSELIVPAGHGAFNHPQAIHELRRILLLNAGISD